MKSHAKAKLTCVPVLIAVAHRLRQQFPRSLASPARRRVVNVHSSSVMPKKLAIDLNLAARTRTIPTATQRLGPVEEAEAEIFHAISVALHGPPGPMVHATGNCGIIFAAAWLVAHSVSVLLRRSPHLGPPTTTLVWTSAAWLATNTLLRASSVPVNVWAQPLLVAWQLSLVGCAAWALVVHLHSLLDMEHVGNETRDLLRATLARLVVGAATLVVLAILRVPLHALLTLGGVSGVVIGFGTQGLVSNVAAGWLLIMSRSVSEGELVELVGHSGVKGVVIHVGLTNTTLRAADNSRLTVPNAMLAAGALRNPADLQNLTWQ
jgi:small-conductance mechanosensitive channel